MPLSFFLLIQREGVDDEASGMVLHRTREEEEDEHAAMAMATDDEEDAAVAGMAPAVMVAACRQRTAAGADSRRCMTAGFGLVEGNVVRNQCVSNSPIQPISYDSQWAHIRMHE